MAAKKHKRHKRRRRKEEGFELSLLPLSWSSFVPFVLFCGHSVFSLRRHSMRFALPLVLLAACVVAVAEEPKKLLVSGDPARIERIRKAKMPKIDKPISFDTPEADAILAALEIFPEDNPWNLVVSDWPLH